MKKRFDINGRRIQKGDVVRIDWSAKNEAPLNDWAYGVVTIRWFRPAHGWRYMWETATPKSKHGLRVWNTWLFSWYCYPTVERSGLIVGNIYPRRNGILKRLWLWLIGE